MFRDEETQIYGRDSSEIQGYKYGGVRRNLREGDRGTSEGKEVDDSDSLYSTRDPNDVSDREILANALESAAKTGEEKEWFADYKKQLDKLNETASALAQANAAIRELAFKKGRTSEESAKLAKAKESAKGYREILAQKDAALLKLEAAGPLRNIICVERDRVKVETRTDFADHASKVKMRERIRRDVKALNKALINPSKNSFLFVNRLVNWKIATLC